MADVPLLRVPYEEFDAGCFRVVGRSAEMQFMGLVTAAFPGPVGYYPSPDSDWRSQKRWVGVLHLFDLAGRHLRTRAIVGGLDSEGAAQAGGRANELLEGMVNELGPVRLCDIYIQPFEAVVDGVVYGLVHERESDEEGDDEYLMLWPNDIMFHPPWDSGEYST